MQAQEECLCLCDFLRAGECLVVAHLVDQSPWLYTQPVCQNALEV